MAQVDGKTATVFADVETATRGLGAGASRVSLKRLRVAAADVAPTREAAALPLRCARDIPAACR